MENQETNNDDAKSEQLARDMQLAYELQAQQEHEASMEANLAIGTNDIASNSNILGGGGGSRGGGSPYASAPSSGNSSSKGNSPFSALGSMFAPRSRNSNALLEDGSANMQSNSSLLYVPAEINGIVCEMMVDSGSQTSVISSSMMQKLKLQKRLNTRYQGVAAGVGAARILGRIDNCAVMLGAGVEFNLFFLVIEVSHDMMILGIDQMRRFNCLIDLQRNVLVFGGQGGVEVPFLPPDPSHANAREQCTIS